MHLCSIWKIFQNKITLFNKSKNHTILKNKRLFIILLVIAILLLIPFIAMQFTSEVSWTSFDFMIMGILLLSTGFLCELVMRKVPKTEHRIALCIGLIIAFLIVWIEIAVGIFGTPFSGS